MPVECVSYYGLGQIYRNRITLSSPAGILSGGSKSFLALWLRREQFWRLSSIPLLVYPIRPSILPSRPRIERIWGHLRRTRSHRLHRDRHRDHHQQGPSRRRECRAHASAVDSRSSRQACHHYSLRLFRSCQLGRDHWRQKGILADCASRLQCDVARPCTLCLRAGATCSATVRPAVWKNHGPGQSPKPSRPNRGSAVDLPAAKRPRRATSVEDMVSLASPTTSPPPDPSTTTGIGTRDSRATSRPPTGETNSSPWPSSSAAVQFMEEVRSESHVPANKSLHISLELLNRSC